jgi:hypothetical protein
VKREAREMLMAKEQDLGQEAVMAMIDLFKTNVENAEIYLEFGNNDDFRRGWVKRELMKMNHVWPDNSAT